MVEEVCGYERLRFALEYWQTGRIIARNKVSLVPIYEAETVLMLHRLKMALPLLFAFLLTFLPFLLLEYNYSQRQKMNETRSLSRWEQESKNFIQLFESLWSHEGQLVRNMAAYRSFRASTPWPDPLNGASFMAEFKSFTPENFWPEAMYAGMFYQSTDKVEMISGGGLRRQKSRFFQMIFESLCSSNLTQKEIESADLRIESAFGSTVTHKLLRSHSKRSVIKVKFESSIYLLYWDQIPIDDDRFLIMMGLFDPDPLPVLQTMYNAVKSILSQDNALSLAFVPLETAADSITPFFMGQDAIENQRLIKELAGTFKGKMRRDRQIPFGTLQEVESLQIIRAFIDYASPYELWMIRDSSSSRPKNIPFSLFLVRFIFASGWIMALVKVMISGRPIGMSLKSWLTLIFIVIGILPLIVLYVAGAFHIESASFRREQEEIRNVVQKFEEVDASSDILINEYRSFFRKATTMPFWTENVTKWQPELWRTAAHEMLRHAGSFGLKIDSVFFYPPEISEVKGFAEVFSDSTEAIRNEQGFYEFLQDLSNKGYHQIAPELMKSEEKELQFFEGELGENVIRGYLALRGDVELVDLGFKRQLHYNNYITKEGMIRNWYVLRLDYTDDLENYLKNAISDLQSGNELNIYALARVENNSANVLFPKPGSSEYGAFWQRSDKYLELAAVTGKGLVRTTEDSLMILYPCNKAGSFILGAMIYMPAFRADAMYQEFILSMLVLLLAVPVFIFSRLIASYLVTPLKEVEAGLDRIGSGDLEVLLRLRRNDELGRLSRAFDAMVGGIRARMHLGRFVSATLDRKVESDTQSEAEGLTQSYGAVLCSDIRNFTSLSEEHSTRDIVAMLNTYLSEMADCIGSNGGLVEQFIGDAVLAVFHGETAAIASFKALTAARHMMQKHDKLQVERAAKGLYSYEIGVGIDAGPLFSGTFQVGDKNEYTMVGMIRKEAESLELLSKKGGFTKIVVSSRVCNLIGPELFVKLSEDSAYELRDLEPLT